MTGYGRGLAEKQGRRAVVEIRSVNHRFLDLKLRGASLEPPVEEALTARLRAALERGSVTASVRVDQRGSAVVMRIDRDAAKRVHDELSEVAGLLGLEGIDLATVVAQPGVLVHEESEADAEVVASCIREAAAQALAGLVRMRETEGAALAADLRSRIHHIAELVRQVAELAKTAPEEGRQRLHERIARLLVPSNIEVDEQRLAQEVAVLADRLDVTEELVRLESHLRQVEAVAAGKGAIGRRLDFLVQEVGRELNTIASKSQSAAIARIVVEAKAELEKVREQVQNIE